MADLPSPAWFWSPSCGTLSDVPAAALDDAEEALTRWRLLRRKLLGRLAELTEAIEAG